MERKLSCLLRFVFKLTSQARHLFILLMTFFLKDHELTYIHINMYIYMYTHIYIKSVEIIKSSQARI